MQTIHTHSNLRQGGRLKTRLWRPAPRSATTSQRFETKSRWFRFDAAHHAPAPRYTLWAATSDLESGGRGGQWRIVLRRADGSVALAVSEVEPDVRGERLALLAVVRGLEALEAPSCVEIVSTSPYVRRGIAFGIRQWRANDWKWESFGRWVPVKHVDLWRRIDRAMQIHHVFCRRWVVADRADVAVRPVNTLAVESETGDLALPAEPRRRLPFQGAPLAQRNRRVG